MHGLVWWHRYHDEQMYESFELDVAGEAEVEAEVQDELTKKQKK